MPRNRRHGMALTPEDVYAKLEHLLGPHDREAVLAVIRLAIACPTCGGSLTTFCTACRGRAGGSTASPAKLKALAEARKKRWPKKRKRKA